MSQLALGLKARPRWGGARARSGSKPGSRPRIRHASRTTVAGRFPCHVTLKVRSGVPSLRRVRLVREIESSFAALRAARSDFRLVHYSLQNDHAHLIVEAEDCRTLANGMKALTARLARAVNRIFRRTGAVLADRYHLHVLRTPREVRNALAYVLLNARKHAKRVLGHRRVDPASSGRWFDGWKTPPEGTREPSDPHDAPVVRPRSWLLATGWRRHGLIDPSELPGGCNRGGAHS